jgi:predicted DNA-binding transcriptional regulator AlpA
LVTTATDIVWIPVATAARILEVSPRQVHRYIEDGKLPNVRRLGNLGWKDVSFDDVMNMVARGTQIDILQGAL